MHRSVLLGLLAFTIVHVHGFRGQVQMPETAQLQQEDDLHAQIKELQRNVSDIWTYIYELRTAVSNHLTHLRQHQVELESSMHTMEHLHESDMRSSGHHHSGEQHSHSGEQHSHSGEHSHGATEQHSHSGEHHSHSDEHHSHSGEHGHHSDSHSHSHSGDDHHHDHDHGHDHKDSHESEDTQTQQAVGPAVEPIVVPTVRQEHYHHHHRQTQDSSSPNEVREEHHHHHHSHSQSSTSDSMNLLSEPFHHHHHHHQDRNRSRTVELPRYSDYEQYDFALCRVQPNRAIPEDQQQEITGTITLWQQKTGGPLNLHLKLQGFDVGHEHHQQVQQEQDNEAPPSVGHRHGFHIHSSGDLSNGCQSTGPHYNPKGVDHGGPRSLVRHVGDLGNIECDEHGNTNIVFSDDVASLTGQHTVVGKAMVIHSSVDDLGLGGDAESLRTGNAGTRLACCVIQKVEKIPIRQYKAMKTATQFQN